MTEPRVLMAVPQYPFPVVGGLERQAHELAKALVDRGVHVQALSGRTDPQQPAEEVVDGVVVHRIPWASSRYLRYLRAPLEVWRVMYRQRQTYDVVHLHQCSWFSLFALSVARWLGKPVLTKLPGVGEYGLPGLAASHLGAVKMRLFSRTDAVVAMSGSSLRELQQAGYPTSRVLRTPNGIRIDGSCKDYFAHGSSQGPCRIVYVGRLGPDKGLEDLLGMWPDVVNRSPGPVQLELWGEGPLMAPLRDLSQRLGIASSVFLRGHVDSVTERLRLMDIFVLLSAGEGNSNAILEAMAVGLPVISTRVGGTPMLIGPEGSRYLLEPGDREGFLDRLLELIGDVSARQALGARMRRRIEELFDIRRIAATYHAAYVLLVAGKRDQIGAIGNPLIAED